MKSVSIAFHKHIEEGHKQGYMEKDELFSEKVNPIFESVSPDVEELPSLKEVYEYIDGIFKSEKLASECLIMCLAYIERLLHKTEIKLCGVNWRRMILASLVLASKVWEDQAVWNVDFLSMFPSLTLEDLNSLERNFLKLLKYDVSMKASIYAEYYFNLRNLSDNHRNFKLKPLSKEEASKLEERSLNSEFSQTGDSTNKTPSLKRTLSDPHLRNEDIPSPPVIIN